MLLQRNLSNLWLKSKKSYEEFKNNGSEKLKAKQLISNNNKNSEKYFSLLQKGGFWLS